MEPVLNLSTLPHDVIRKVIQVGSDLAPDVRLISPTWNTLTEDYLSKNRVLPAPLERVYLSRGVPEEVVYFFNALLHYFNFLLCRWYGWLPLQKIHMYAILPERFSKRVGVNGWLEVHENHAGGSIEVKSKPMRVSDFYVRLLSYGFRFDALLAVPCTIAYLFGRAQSFPGVELIIGGACYHVSNALNELVDGWRRAGDRFGRFFSSFMHIDTLVLENFAMSSIDVQVREDLSAVLGALAGVRINRLEVRDNDLNQRLQKRLIETCRTHKIRHLFITVQDLYVDGFKDFVLELSELNVTLDLYERNGLNDTRYFYQSMQYWLFMEADLMGDGVSLTMNTIHDPTFDRTEYRFGVKSHIRCENLDGNPIQPLRAVTRLRGFNHRWN